MTLGSYLDEESSPWWDYLIGFPGIVIGGVKSLFGEDTVPASGGRQGTIELTKEVNEKINFLKKKISASIDKKNRHNEHYGHLTKSADHCGYSRFCRS